MGFFPPSTGCAANMHCSALRILSFFSTECLRFLLPAVQMSKNTLFTHRVIRITGSRHFGAASAPSLALRGRKL